MASATPNEQMGIWGRPLAGDHGRGEPAPKRARSDDADTSAELQQANGTNGESSPNGSTQQPNPRLYSCGKCTKSYARLDHLSRHVRMHTQEKPYQCQVCSKAFARADLLKRHTQGHSKDDPQSKPNIIQHSRVSQAVCILMCKLSCILRRSLTPLPLCTSVRLVHLCI